MCFFFQKMMEIISKNSNMRRTVGLVDDAGLGDLDALDVRVGLGGEAEDLAGTGILQQTAGLRLLSGHASELHLKDSTRFFLSFCRFSGAIWRPQVLKLFKKYCRKRLAFSAFYMVWLEEDVLRFYKKKAYLLLLSLSVLGAAGALHHGLLGEADSVRVLDDAGLLDGLWNFTRFSLFFSLLLSKIPMKLTDFLVGVVFGVVALVLLLVVALGGLVLLIGFLRIVVLAGLAVVLVVLLLRDAFLFDFALKFPLVVFPPKRPIALLPRHP